MLNRILIIGAGKSSPFLIEYLYERRFNLNIDLTVLADKKPDYFEKNFKDLNFIKININDSNVLKEVLVPFPAESMEAYPVSKLVNSPKNDNPACIVPFS